MAGVVSDISICTSHRLQPNWCVCTPGYIWDECRFASFRPILSLHVGHVGEWAGVRGGWSGWLWFDVPSAFQVVDDLVEIAHREDAPVSHSTSTAHLKTPRQPLAHARDSVLRTPRPRFFPVFFAQDWPGRGHTKPKSVHSSPKASALANCQSPSKNPVA